MRKVESGKRVIGEEFSIFILFTRCTVECKFEQSHDVVLLSVVM